MTNPESRLAQAIIGRIHRYRRGRTDLPSLLLQIHLFVETYESDHTDWHAAFHDAWSGLVECTKFLVHDSEPGRSADEEAVDGHLQRIERLLRNL